MSEKYKIYAIHYTRLFKTDTNLNSPILLRAFTIDLFFKRRRAREATRLMDLFTKLEGRGDWRVWYLHFPSYLNFCNGAAFP